MKTKREIGQFYTNGNIYFLCQIDCAAVALVNLGNGNRWEDPVTVENVYNISSEEWKLITDNEKFKQVKTSIRKTKNDQDRK